MQPPMMGTWRVRIIAVRPFAIHGDNYFELLITRLDTPQDDQAEVVLRAPEHAFTSLPGPGQTADIQFLMGQVTAITRL